MEFNISKNRRVAMFQSRSNDLIEIESCKIADPKISIDALNSQNLEPGSKIEVVVDGLGNTHSDHSKSDRLPYEVSGQKFEVSLESFWQSHKNAPSLLSDVVTMLAGYRAGDHIVDLYSGIGVLTSPSLKVIGLGGRLTLVEESESAISDAKWNFATANNVEICSGRVEKEIQKLSSCDLVILDPPRSGAGAKVLNEIVRLAPRTVIYVACDPAALARDAGYLATRSYAMDTLRAFDLFPMTQHMECVARFIRS
jgi:tRNA/tmRNA/rRNA uracil-C5-methylase (TrmA/RlmC/RlmD family)